MNIRLQLDRSAVMKIDDIVAKQRLETPKDSTRQVRTEQKKAFEAFLEQEIGADNDLFETMTDPSPVQGMLEMPGILANSAHPSIPLIGEGNLDWIKATESRLSSIQASLDAANGDPRKLESIIQSLPKDAETLKSQLGELSGGHPLKSVADELEVLAYVESIKWDRGDYL
jgi:hypothetical protein